METLVMIVTVYAGLVFTIKGMSHAVDERKTLREANSMLMKFLGRIAIPAFAFWTLVAYIEDGVKSPFQLLKENAPVITFTDNEGDERISS